MSMLLTTGLSSALLAAKTYYSVAESPMQRASEEFQSRNTDLDILNRNLEYGSAEMFRAEQATILAGIELQKALAMARMEAQELQASRIEECRERNAERAAAMRDGGEVKPFAINYSKDDKDEEPINKTTTEKKTMWNFLENTQSNGISSIFTNASNATKTYNRFGVASSLF